MSFGVTSTGFVRPALVDIITEWEQRVRDLFGSVNTAPESVFGQLIGTEAEREDRLWQALEAVYYAGYPASSAGRSLDGVVQLTGITRLGATRSFANIVLIGVPSSTIPSGSQVSVDPSGSIFETLISYELLPASVIQTRIVVATVAVSTAYTITINSVAYTYSTAGDPTEAAILAGLVAALPAFIDVEIDGTELFLIVADRVSAFSLAVTATLTIVELGVPATVRAIDFGRTLALSPSLNQIETPVAGWDAVINYVDGTAGREIESDSELRIRRAQSLNVSGTATVDAIRARLLAQVVDVTAVTIIENRLSTVDDEGRPPHSFEAVVSGGTDEDVANKIWEVKPAGIQTTGDIGEIITDSTGREHEMRFSRPIDVYVWIKVTLAISGQNTFPDNGEVTIASGIVAQGDLLGVGDDILHQSLFGPIYAVPGVVTATVEIAVTASPETVPAEYEYVEENVTIASIEISVWALARVDVEVLE